MIEKNAFYQFAAFRDFAKQIRNHKPLIMNWFHSKKAFSSAVVEALNNKSKVTSFFNRTNC